MINSRNLTAIAVTTGTLAGLLAGIPASAACRTRTVSAHWTGTRLIETQSPAQQAALPLSHVIPVAPIPGTASAWAAGSVHRDSVIALYGATP